MKRRTYGTNKVAELKIKIEQARKDQLFAKATREGLSVGEYVRQIVAKDLDGVKTT